MRTEYFHYLLEIDECQSISAAARKLFVVQTTLSSIVRSVETELGFPIFNRTPQGIITTTRGQEFLAIAREINAKMNEAVSELDPSAHWAQTSVLLSPGFSVGLPLLLSRALRETRPEALLTFVEAHHRDVVDQLLKDTAKVGITHIRTGVLERVAQSGEDTPVIRRLGRERFFVLARRGRLSPAGAEVCPEDLRDSDLAVLSDFSSAFSTLLAPDSPPICRSATVLPQAAQAIAAVKEQGLITILPGSILGFEKPDEALEILPTNGFLGLRGFERCLLSDDTCYLGDAEEWILRELERLLSTADSALPPPIA